MIENEDRQVPGVWKSDVLASDIISLPEVEGIKAYIDTAVWTADGVLFATGWVYDPENLVRGFAAVEKLDESEGDDEGGSARLLLSGQDGTSFLSVDRADVTEATGGVCEHDQHGFVLIVPDFSLRFQLALSLVDDRYIELAYRVLTEEEDIEALVQRCMVTPGPVIYTLLQDALGDGHALVQTASELLLAEAESFQQRISCDRALLLDEQVLLLNGWIGARRQEIHSVTLLVDETRIDITSRMYRYRRPDLHEVFPKAAEEALGFIAAVPMPANKAQSVTLEVKWHTGEREKSHATGIDTNTWNELKERLQGHPNLFPPVVEAISAVRADIPQNTIFSVLFERFKRETFPHVARALPVMVDHQERVLAAVDRAYALGKDGMLVFGWQFSPHTPPRDISVCDERGQRISVQRHLLPLVREDVANGYAERFAGVSRYNGFAVYVPLPTEVGDARAICFHYPERGDVWMRLPVNQYVPPSIVLIKEMLGMIPHPGFYNHRLFAMFEDGLGKALEAINQQRLSQAPAIEDTMEVRQFGTPPDTPTTSIVVPLYGRCDFVRHQLARFADDAEMANSDLIYVIDDPGLVEQTLELAARYQWLFNVPFRVVWYGRNLGFAGANNAGASLARADRLLLLNSDVIPQQTGWLGTLEQALDALPEAGAVGPLLQFGDGSVQHAGMHPRQDPQLPGFVLNTHPGMGLQWEGNNDAYEQPLLTAACLMLRTRDYADYGGFDEGYVIGDFEDSDLCLGLRTRGQRLYVVPEAKLWHLERQSQTLGNVADVRQLITLFNGWRYQQKIASGELINPLEISYGQEAQA